jgi:hypothetical protein
VVGTLSCIAFLLGVIGRIADVTIFYFVSFGLGTQTELGGSCCEFLEGFVRCISEFPSSPAFRRNGMTRHSALSWGKAHPDVNWNGTMNLYPSLSGLSGCSVEIRPVVQRS